MDLEERVAQLEENKLPSLETMLELVDCSAANIIHNLRLWEPTYSYQRANDGNQ